MILTRVLLLLLTMLSAHSASSLSLQGKRVIVTGSSGGIGKSLALQLGCQHGCHVLVHYHQRLQGAIDTCDQIRQASGTAVGPLQADFRDQAQIHQFMQQADEIWPDGFDILINNAGIVTQLALEDDTDDLAAWHECMAVNLHAPRLLSHLALERMQKRIQQQQQSPDNPKEAVIINVSSIHGERSNEFIGAYAVSKAALESLTRTMALEYAVHGIRVNAIAPGVGPVERTHASFFDSNDQPTPLAEQWKSRIPLHRLGTPQQVAQATIPLLTNDWLTGVIWQIDGGMMARNNMPPRLRPLKEGGRV